MPGTVWKLAAAATVIGAILLATWGLRSSLGIELNPTSVRAFVADLGPLAPLVFVGLTSFRLFIGIPSQLLLVAGGLCFGTAAGTLYGAAGLAISGLWLFAMARWVGREMVASRVPVAIQSVFDNAGARAGPALVAVGTAYPMGPISAYHTVAGVTAMSALSFAAALCLGSVARAATYTFFGSSLTESPAMLLTATAVIVVVGLTPLAFAGPRAWVLRLLSLRRDQGRPESTGDLEEAGDGDFGGTGDAAAAPATSPRAAD